LNNLILFSQERKSILQGLSANIPVQLKETDLDQLAEGLDGWTGSDIDNLCREAALIALRENIDSKMVHPDRAFGGIFRSLGILIFSFSQVSLDDMERAKLACRPSLSR
jgi:SpoVK/Ycf46/Vps4 family AAA+-type ATPase